VLLLTQLDHENNFYRNGFFSYDAIGERTRFFERVEENAPRPQFDVLDLYKEVGSVPNNFMRQLRVQVWEKKQRK